MIIRLEDKQTDHYTTISLLRAAVVVSRSACLPYSPRIRARIMLKFIVFSEKYCLKVTLRGSGCVAQLVERLLPIQEVRSLNPVIGNFFYIY